MTDLNVTFAHPTNGRTIVATLDEDITAQEVVAELIAAEFIEPQPYGYELATKNGSIILPSQSLGDGNVQDNTTLRLIPLFEAGIGV